MEKNIEAKAQLDRLEALVIEKAAGFDAKFLDEITKHLAKEHITDAQQIAFDRNVKTEYVSEFNIKLIADVVSNVLHALAAAQSGVVPNAALSEKAIEAYSNVVATVAEAAKSRSESGASMSVNAMRAAPGMLSFLWAVTLTLKDEETFGSESVSCTAVVYRLMRSAKSLEQETDFDLAWIAAATLVQMKELQASLVQLLAKKKIDIDEWTRRDSHYAKAVAKLKREFEGLLPDRQKDRKKDTLSPQVLGEFATPEFTLAAGVDPVDMQGRVSAAIAQLATGGEAYRDVIRITQERLDAGYFYD